MKSGKEVIELFKNVGWAWRAVQRHHGRGVPVPTHTGTASTGASAAMFQPLSQQRCWRACGSRCPQRTRPWRQPGPEPVEEAAWAPPSDSKKDVGRGCVLGRQLWTRFSVARYTSSPSLNFSISGLAISRATWITTNIHRMLRSWMAN